MGGGRIIEFIYFPTVLVLYEMQKRFVVWSFSVYTFSAGYVKCFKSVEIYLIMNYSTLSTHFTPVVIRVFTEF